MLLRTWKHQHDFNKGHSHHHHCNHDHDHPHSHHEKELKALNVVSPEYHDAHELEHAQDINRRFSNKNITNREIIIFGLTGGLIPCPASITVLLLCLQLKKIVLGSVLVLGFSVGLAVTMVLTGVVASLSVTHLTKRWSGFSKVARRAPYFSGFLISAVGLYVSYHGLISI
jgi:nickel/cobalt exporter